jgi:hypothetical protein
VQFEVTGSPATNPLPDFLTFTGIAGTVKYVESSTELSGSDDTGALSTSRTTTLLAGAQIVIQTVEATNANSNGTVTPVWVGQTDGEGGFHAPLAPGEYSVTVVKPANLITSSSVPLLTRTVSVKVNTPTTAEFAFHANRYRGELEQAGIRGNVVADPSYSGVDFPFNLPVPPVPGARVVVEQQGVGASGFRWAGAADQSGKYKIETPAGVYRVTATIPAGQVGAGLSKSSTVTVYDGSYTGYTSYIHPSNIVIIGPPPWSLDQ